MREKPRALAYHSRSHDNDLCPSLLKTIAGLPELEIVVHFLGQDNHLFALCFHRLFPFFEIIFRVHKISIVAHLDNPARKNYVKRGVISSVT
jgi:hypothetical protein